MEKKQYHKFKKIFKFFLKNNYLRNMEVPINKKYDSKIVKLLYDSNDISHYSSYPFSEYTKHNVCLSDIDTFCDTPLPFNPSLIKRASISINLNSCIKYKVKCDNIPNSVSELKIFICTDICRSGDKTYINNLPTSLIKIRVYIKADNICFVDIKVPYGCEIKYYDYPTRRVIYI